MSVAVVTGASRGLGKSLALLLAQRGHTVVAVARDVVALSYVSVEAMDAGAAGRILPVGADVANPRDVAHVASVVADLGGADLLINNAATLGPTPLPWVLDLEPDALLRLLQVNVVGPQRMIRALVGAMVLKGAGTVVNVTSDAAHGAWPGWGGYGSTKAALELLSHTLAAELDGTGVRVLLHDPGEVDTDMHAEAVPDADRSTLTPPAVAAAALLRQLDGAA